MEALVVFLIWVNVQPVHKENSKCDPAQQNEMRCDIYPFFVKCYLKGLVLRM